MKLNRCTKFVNTDSVIFSVHGTKIRVVESYPLSVSKLVAIRYATNVQLYAMTPVYNYKHVIKYKGYVFDKFFLTTQIFHTEKNSQTFPDIFLTILVFPDFSRFPAGFPGKNGNPNPVCS